DVVLHGLLGEEELLGDGLVGEAAGDGGEDLALALGQAQARGVAGLDGLLRGGAHRVQGDGGGDGGERGPGSGGDIVQCAVQLVGAEVPVHQVPGGTAAQGRADDIRVLGVGEHDDLGEPGELLDGAHPVPNRHAHVEQDDVGPVPLRLGEGLGAVAGLGDDLDVVRDLQECDQPGSDDHIVVDGQDGDGGC